MAIDAVVVPTQNISLSGKIGAHLRPYLVIAVILVIWEAVARAELVSTLMLPPVSMVWQAAYEKTISGELLLSIAWSSYRVLLGFSVGLALAFPVGVAIGWSKPIRELFNPVVEVLRPVPPLAWIPLAVIWFGVGFQSVLFITVLGSFFPVVLAVIAGVQNVDKKMIEFSRTLGASTRQILLHVAIPAALPSTFVGMRIAIGFSWMVVVAAEMISVKYGLGWMIWRARFALETEVVIVGMIAIGVLSVGMTKCLLLVERRVFRWREHMVKG